MRPRKPLSTVLPTHLLFYCLFFKILHFLPFSTSFFGLFPPNIMVVTIDHINIWEFFCFPDPARLSYYLFSFFFGGRIKLVYVCKAERRRMSLLPSSLKWIFFLRSFPILSSLPEITLAKQTLPKPQKQIATFGGRLFACIAFDNRADVFRTCPLSKLPT